MTTVYETISPEETFQMAKLLSESAKPGEIYCLNGELGVGKTVFVKGFASGLGIEDPVVSPTFTILQEYRSGRLPLFHFDVYRIEDPDELYELGYEEYFFGDGVTMIEWSTLVAELIPNDAVRVLIKKDLSKGTDYRKITVIKRES